jgi:cytochrome P450
LEIYGPNVLTTEGQDGRFHRKVTGKLFSERNVRLVYEESVRQASQMLTSWGCKYNNEIILERYPSPVVLSAVFGRRRSNLRCMSSLPPASVFLSWNDTGEEIWPQHNLSLRDAIWQSLHNLLPIMVVPKALWGLPLKSLRAAADGYSEFGRYMHELVERERAVYGRKRDNLLSTLVRHATEHGKEDDRMLTDEEIIENTFIFLIAGHESTYILHLITNTSANTLPYSLLMLAIHPRVQIELQREIEDVCGDRIPTYEDISNLVYPLCIMFETLRMFPIITGIPKCTVKGEMLLGKYYIPKDTTLVYDVVQLQRNPKYWGDDADIFNPSRFDGRAEKSDASNEDIPANGKFKFPVKGAFCPFSECPRACLGISRSSSRYSTEIPTTAMRMYFHSCLYIIPVHLFRFNFKIRSSAFLLKGFEYINVLQLWTVNECFLETSTAPIGTGSVFDRRFRSSTCGH